MAFFPTDLWSLAGFALAIGGTAVLLATDWPKAYGLGIVIMALFGVQALAGDNVILDLGFTAESFLAGAWWTPFTYMFLHAGVYHIAGNLLILLTAGPLLEDRIGSKRFLAVYFLAGFAAVAAQVGLQALDLIGPGIAVGASGAIFGVLTLLAVHWPRERIPFPMLIIIWLPAFVVLLIHLGMNLMYMVSGARGIAWYGHFAGYLVGLAAAGVVRPGKLPAPGGGPTDKRARKGLPDVDALRPLATSRELKEFLEKAEQFKGEDQHDATFALSWVDKFATRARCPEHDEPLKQDGRTLACPRGDFEVRY